MAQFLTDATFAGNVAINGSTGITGLNGITFENGCILDDSIGAEYLKLKYNGANAGGMQIFDNENTIQGYIYASGAATSEFGLLTGAGEWGVRTKENAEVGLYHNNSQKLQTTTNGVTVTGGLTVGAINSTGTITMSGGGVRAIVSGGDIALKTSTGEYALYGAANGNTNLYYNGLQKIRTGSDGVVVTGNITVSGTVDGVDIAALNTAVAANTSKTGITSAQASAITANTAKTGITSSQSSAITANTSKTGITSAQATGIVTNSAYVAAKIAQKTKAGGNGPNQENLNTIADAVTVGQMEYRGFNGSSSNAPSVSDNANGVISVGQHNGGYGAQLAFSSNGQMYWRDNPSTSFGSWRKLLDDGNTTTISTAQASAITANTAKTGISSAQTSAITANTAKTGITSSQASAITANTSKTGITSSQASAITANTSKTGITSSQASAITANTSKTGITSSQASAITANTSKTGITSAQASAITANTSKTGITSSQSSAITANTAKTGISSSQTSAITANTNKTGISSAQTSAITANTAKTGITSSQASAITANTSKTGISTGQANAITANTNKTGISSAQTSAITANTSKTGITSTQTSNITTNNAKIGVTSGTQSFGGAKTFTTTPISVTRSTADSSTYLATTAFVKNQGYITSAGNQGTVTSVATTNGITGGTITGSGTIQCDSTVVRTTGDQSISGNKEFAPSSAATGYQTAAIELLASSSGASGTPPRISWHWGGVVASLITVETNGTIAVRNNPGNAYEQFAASNLTLHSGSLILNGTGRIQGIDTVSAGTDAASKDYVDNSIGRGTLSMTTSTGLNGSASFSANSSSNQTFAVTMDLDELNDIDGDSDIIDFFIAVDESDDSVKIGRDDMKNVDAHWKHTPFVLNSNFLEQTNTTSYINVPFNNTNDSTSSEYYNFFGCPYPGRVKSMTLMHVDGNMSSGFTTQLRVKKNGATAYTSGELTPSNGTNDGSYVQQDDIHTSFVKGDRLQFALGKSVSSRYWQGATMTIVLEFLQYNS